MAEAEAAGPFDWLFCKRIKSVAIHNLYAHLRSEAAHRSPQSVRRLLQVYETRFAFLVLVRWESKRTLQRILLETTNYVGFET